MARPNMVNRTIRFTPGVWAKVEARAEAREQTPSEWVRRLVEAAVEDDRPAETLGTRPGTPPR